MTARVQVRGQSALTRVLAVASDAAALAPACVELIRRGASVSAVGTVPEASASVRREAFDVVMIAPGVEANAARLLIQIIRAEAIGAPRVLLLVEPDEASVFSPALVEADEALSAALPATRIADAAGIGVAELAPEATPNLPATYAPPRHKILALPLGLPRDRLPPGVAHVERGEVPDAVILLEPAADSTITAWMSTAAAAVVPIVDATGRHEGRCDASIATASALGVADALERVAPLTARMRQLPDGFFRTRDERHMLLARLAVRDRALTAALSTEDRAIVRYRDEAAVPGVLAHAEGLARVGHLKRRFFEKLQCCGSCQSSRLLVREECAKCRSPDIAEEPILHHLRCGYQGPERDFSQGRDLVCPKCRGHLEHFSVDYDKPGALNLCNACGHTTGEPEVGFKCLDCADAFPADKAIVRSFHEYELTDAGRAAAFAPPLGGYGPADGTTGNPRERLRAFAAACRRDARPFAVLLAKLDPEGAVVARLGEKRVAPVAALYASLLREVFTDDVEIAESATSFLVMIRNETPERVSVALPDIRRELETHLALDLEPRYAVFGPDEIFTLL